MPLWCCVQWALVITSWHLFFFSTNLKALGSQRILWLSLRWSTASVISKSRNSRLRDEAADVLPCHASKLTTISLGDDLNIIGETKRANRKILECNCQCKEQHVHHDVSLCNVFFWAASICCMLVFCSTKKMSTEKKAWRWSGSDSKIWKIWNHQKARASTIPVLRHA